MARPKGMWSDKAFRDALRIAVNRRLGPGGEKKLAAMADKLVDEALAGDVRAIREVADRLDGRPHQSVDVVTTADPSGEHLAALRATMSARQAMPSDDDTPGTTH